MSRYIRMFVAVAALGVVGTGTAAAQTATQVVGFEVQAISVLSASGSPSLVISTAVAGSQPSQATASGSYAITTNETNRKITIQINSNMPSGLTLTANLTAPSVGASAGALTLSTTPQDAVTAIAQVVGSGLTIAYTLDATVAAGVVAAGTRTVTLTIVTGP